MVATGILLIVSVTDVVGILTVTLRVAVMVVWEGKGMLLIVLLSIALMLVGEDITVSLMV